MKIVFQNNTPFDFKAECDETMAFFAKHNVPLEFTFKRTYVNTPIVVRDIKQGFSPTTGQPALINRYGLSNSTIDKNFDITIFCWDMDTMKSYVDENGVITSWTLQTGQIQLAINKYLKDKGDVANRIKHEIMHALCIKAQCRDEMDMTTDGKAFYKNDNPDAPDGNYSRTFKNLQPFINSLQKPMYKYFKESEIVGLKPELVEMLDKARGIAGIPFKITSGYRTPEHNLEVGGVSGSSHTTGEAVDLLIKDSYSGFKMINACLQVGFKRLGYYIDGHLHVDCSKTLPQEVFWIK